MIAIIPARGGSKGLPGKNIRLLSGIPLIAHTILSAKASRYITDVIISTDDQQTYDIGMSYGCLDTFLRPAYLAGDDSKAIDTYIYTIDKLNETLGINIENFVVLQPTSPLRASEDIDGAIDLFYQKSADSVISYTEELHPVIWHKYIDAENRLEDIFPATLENRQALRKSYYPNGAVFVFRKQLIYQRKYYSNRSYAYIMPRERSVDIDTIFDFEYAEFLMGKRR